MRLAFVSFLFLSLAAGAQELPLKTIELEWEPVENAFGYEIRLTPKQGGEPLSFRVFENNFTHDVPVGVYVLRIRSRHKDVEDHWSPWSDPIALEVLIKELLPLEPANEAVIVAKGNAREEVTFAWRRIEKARDYVLKIWTDETKDKPMTFVTRKNTQRLKLLPGRVYHWQVVFESATQVTYAQEVRTHVFMLQGQKLIQPSINADLSWSAVPKAKGYRAKLSFHFLDETKWQTVRTVDVAEAKWPAGEKLKPGMYRLEVTAHAPRHADSDVAVYEFTIKPTEAELNQILAGVGDRSGP